MKTFSLTGASALSPARLRAGLLDPRTWRSQGATLESEGGDALTASFPLPADSVPEALSRFVPDRASLRMEVRADAEAPAGTPQTAHLAVTVPGAPVMVRVVFTAHPTAPASQPTTTDDHDGAGSPGAGGQTAGPSAGSPGAGGASAGPSAGSPGGPSAGPSDAEGAGSTVTAHAELESSVPLFGPMVESALEPVVRSQLREKFDQLVDLR